MNCSDYTVKKAIAANGRASNVNWFTISSPLTASTALANVKGLIPTTVTATDYDLYRLDEENGEWVNSKLSSGANPDFTTIDKGVGYIYHRENGTTLEFNGKINAGDVERSLTTGAAHGFNLIGNPFTQNIKLTDIRKESADFADGFYVLSNENTWGARLTDSEIKPLQGFLVQATVAGDVTISKPSPGSKGERSDKKNANIEIVVSNGIYSDNAFAMFGEGMLQVFDVLGKVVISEEVHGQRVDVSKLTTGAYIVRMTGNEVKTQKIIAR